MQLLLALTLAVIVPVSGLVSCSGDKSEHVDDPWSPVGPVIVETHDGVPTYRSLKRSAGPLDPSGRIEFQARDRAAFEDAAIEVDTTCNDGQKEFSRSTSFRGPQSLPVSGLLPREIWREVDLSKHENTHCSIKVTARNPRGLERYWPSSRMRLGSFDKLINQRFKDARQDTRLDVSSLSSAELTQFFAPEARRVTLACDDFDGFRELDRGASQDTILQELAQQGDKVLNRTSQNCRLITESLQDPGSVPVVSISPMFKLNYPLPRVEVSHRWGTPKFNGGPMNNTVLFHIFVTNRSQVTTGFRVPIVATRGFKFRPVLKRPDNHYFAYSETIADVAYEAEGASAYFYQNSYAIFAVPPLGTVTLTARIRSDANCLTRGMNRPMDELAGFSYSTPVRIQLEQFRNWDSLTTSANADAVELPMPELGTRWAPVSTTKRPEIENPQVVMEDDVCNEVAKAHMRVLLKHRAFF